MWFRLFVHLASRRTEQVGTIISIFEVYKSGSDIVDFTSSRSSGKHTSCRYFDLGRRAKSHVTSTRSLDSPCHRSVRMSQSSYSVSRHPQRTPSTSVRPKISAHHHVDRKDRASHLARIRGRIREAFEDWRRNLLRRGCSLKRSKNT